MAAESRYPIPAGRAHIELTIINSRFIADAAPTPDVATAKAFIGEIRAAFHLGGEAG